MNERMVKADEKRETAMRWMTKKKKKEKGWRFAATLGADFAPFSLSLFRPLLWIFFPAKVALKYLHFHCWHRQRVPITKQCFVCTPHDPVG